MPAEKVTKTDHGGETIKSYNLHFDKYISGTPNQVSGEHKILLEKFASLVGGDKNVLELGSAFLRDAKFLKNLGLNVTCTDVIKQSVEMAKKEGFPTFEYDFRDEPRPEWTNSFDAVVALAVLLHADTNQFAKALENIFQVMKKGGVFYLALKQGVGEEVENEKLGGPRYFKYWQKEEVEKHLQEAGFKIELFDYVQGIKWLHFLARK
jgi:SAM-dependent methyltransferase